MITNDIAAAKIPPNPGEQSPSGGRLAMRAYRLLFLTVIFRPFGNLSLAWGMKHVVQAVGLNPLFYASAFKNPYVAAGIGMLVLSLLTRMALLSIADLSFVLPLTAVGYIISVLLGRVFLQEEVSVAHWAGTALVFVGVALVSSTSLRSGAEPTSGTDLTSISSNDHLGII